MARKKKKEENQTKADVGMVMTVSLFLILLTFFILLNSIAVLDDIRIRRAIGSLIGAFGGLPGGLSALATGESILPPSAPMMDEELSVDQLMAYINKQPTLAMAGSLRVENTEDGEMITITEKALLAADRSVINPSITPFLKKLGSLINKGDYPVEIIGHTDGGVPQDKGYKSNWELSTLTALKVLKHFVSESKIASERLTAYGFGSSRPVVSNDTVHSRAQNRRVEIALRYRAPDYVKRIFKKRSPGFFTYKKFDFKIF